MRRRSSQAPESIENPELFTSKPEKDALEARNALLQFDETLRLVRNAKGVLHLTPQILCALQKLAIQDIYKCAGTYRKRTIYISNSLHETPPFQQVEKLVEEMCDYVNTSDGTPIHLAAYLMWRVNWIHPFSGGNGRTSRAVSYLALCTKYDTELPGTPTIPDLIAADRVPYYMALDAADAACRAGRIDVTTMENLISDLLLRQLSSVPASS